jgi:putative DNA primase/helicase
MPVLMKSKYDTDGDKPQPYLAKLAGKRLAYASESAEDMRLDAAKVKGLTGGDRINARGLHKDPNEFKATHKLALFTNRKPTIPPDDQAVWDRIMLIELKMRFVDNPDPKKPNERKRDKTLGEKLKAEYSGILAWLVRGAIEWRTQGLKPPDKVTIATTEYQNSEDILQTFIDERIKFTNDPKDILNYDPNAAVQASTLYFAYKNWTSAYGLNPITLTAFGQGIKQKFEDKNVIKDRDPQTRAYIWKGIKL